MVDLKANLVAAFKEARAGKAIDALEYLPGYHALHDQLHDLAKDSSNEKFVHSNVNRLINKTVGIEAGTRSKQPPAIKARLAVAQEVALRSMESANDHHDGYQMAKDALGTLGKALRVV